MTTRKIFLLSALASLGLWSCDSTTTTAPLSGTLSGRVELVAANGNLTPGKGATVSLEGTSMTTTADSNGVWSFPNLHGGDYTIDYSLAGYGESKSEGAGLVGGGNRDLGFIYLDQAPAFGIGSITQYFPAKSGDSSSLYLVFATTDSTVSGGNKIFLFFGNDPTVGWNPSNYLSVSVQSGEFHHGLDSLRILPATLATAGYALGNTVYLRAYIGNAGTLESGYTDLTSGRFLYTDLDTTTVAAMKLTVP
jgi:hypothetical protein